MDYKQKYEFWLQHVTDKDVKQSLLSMQNDDKEIENAFYKDLEFGTGGLRGVMTAGTDRMNVYTIFRASEGLARYMDAHGYVSCAITYDSRNNSKLFSEMASATLAQHNIKVYITKECMPTPYLSFMTRHYGCDIGINVTASHNPSIYNGYKVYDSNGCQLTDNSALEVTSYIQTVQLFEKPLPNFDEYVGKQIVYATDDVEKLYKDTVISQSLNNAGGIRIAYTPLNGAGYRVVPEVLRTVGANDLHVVQEQSSPNGNFPTCPYPNPEKHEAMALAVQLGKDVNADIVIGNDPDCDRLGVAVNQQSEFVILTGNEVGVLLCDWILSRLSEQNKLPKNPVIVKTIVTTIIANAIANKYGASVVDVLTGFKYIGDVIAKLEAKGQTDSYVFGFEESCGYLKGTYVRDKDGVVASMLIAECASYYKHNGLTLVERLEQLYKEHGYFYQQLANYRFEGAQGAVVKAKLLQDLRVHPITHLGNSKVIKTTDFLTQTEADLPKADVLRYNSEDGSQLVIRPSGTEPLIKCYITTQGDKQGNLQRFDAIKAQIDKLFA